MSTEFDPYHKWLGIPAGKRPPTYYQLLGISRNESDRDAIEAAAERQSTFVRQFRGTEHDEAAARILFEIDQARHTLLDVAARRQYDASLQQRQRRQRSHLAGAVPAQHASPSVGEESGIVRQYAGIVAVLTIAFFGMAAAAFWLPWGKSAKSSDGSGAEVAQAAPPADLPPVQARKQTPPADVVAQKPPEPVKNDVAAEPEVTEAPPKAEAAPKVVKLPKDSVTLKEHTGPVGRLAFSRDGARLVSGSFDSTVKVWDIESGKVLTSFAKHTNGISSVDISPDGATVASSGGDNTIRLFDAKTGEETAKFEQAGQTTRVAFLSDGKTLLSSSADKTIKQWEIGQSMPTASYDKGLAGMGMALSSDGLTFAYSLKGKVIIRSTADGKVVSELPIEMDGVALSLAFSPDGKNVVGTVLGREVVIWDVSTRKKVKSLKGTWTVLHTLALHPSGNLVATSSTRVVGKDSVQEIKLIEIESGTERKTVVEAVQKRPLLGFAFSPDGEVFAVGKEDGSIDLMTHIGQTQQIGQTVLDNESKPKQAQTLGLRVVRLELSEDGEGKLMIDSRNAAGRVAGSATPSATPVELVRTAHATVVRLEDGTIQMLHDFRKLPSLDGYFDMIANEAIKKQHMRSLTLDRNAGTLVLTPIQRGPHPYRGWGADFQCPRGLSLPLTLEARLIDQSDGSFTIWIPFAPGQQSLMLTASLGDPDHKHGEVRVEWNTAGKTPQAKTLAEGVLQSEAVGEYAFRLPPEAVKEPKTLTAHIGILGKSVVSIKSIEVSGSVRPNYGAYFEMKENKPTVRQVLNASGAEKAGLKAGDIVVKIDGVSVTVLTDVYSTLQRHKIGELVPFVVQRKDQLVTLKVPAE